MKTTIELPDELLIAAKATAARRRTTLRALFEHALKRELKDNRGDPAATSAIFSVDEHGLPVLKKKGETPVTSELVYQLLEEEGI